MELGKKFCILAELWVDECTLARPYPTTIQDNSPWSLDRYNSTTKQDGVTAEIYACVPKEFHKLVHISPLFSSTVCIVTSIPPSIIYHLTIQKFLEGMGDMRGYMIDTIRKHATSIFGITGLEGSEFRTSSDRSMVPQFTELLQSPHAPEQRFATYPRVLYQDHNTRKLLFGSQVIVNVSTRLSYQPHSVTIEKILRAIFLGPTSVGKSGRIRHSGPRPLASRLELTSITPGAISAAGIIVRNSHYLIHLCG